MQGEDRVELGEAFKNETHAAGHELLTSYLVPALWGLFLTFDAPMDPLASA